MRPREFLDAVVSTARDQLPRKLRGFSARHHFNLIKIYFDRPTLHYEVWIRGKDHLIESGLHFEADQTTNTALREYFAAHELEIRIELGARVEVEQWTQSWARVHEVVPFTTLDASLAKVLGTKLARMIGVLQPLLEKVLW
jgi:hypothetical protein